MISRLRKYAPAVLALWIASITVATASPCCDGTDGPGIGVPAGHHAGASHHAASDGVADDVTDPCCDHTVDNGGHGSLTDCSPQGPQSVTSRAGSSEDDLSALPPDIDAGIECRTASDATAWTPHSPLLQSIPFFARTARLRL